MALPRAFLAHSVPGRTRLRIPDMRKNLDYFGECERRLARHQAVSGVHVNPLTGSVLIDHSTDGLALERLARDVELFEIGEGMWSQPLGVRLQERLYGFANQFERASGGELDVPGLAIVVLTSLGLMQIANGRGLPAGWTMLWHASSLLRQVHKDRAPQPEPQPVTSWTTH